MVTTHMKTQSFHCKERFLEYSLDPENTLKRVFSTTRAIKGKDVKCSYSTQLRVSGACLEDFEELVIQPLDERPHVT
jgi:hypothetical protein